MRILSLLAPTTFVLPAVLAAQSPTPGAPAGARLAGAPSVGVMAGVNSTTFSGDLFGASSSPQRRAGFVGGLYVSLPVGSPVFAVRPEVLFAQQGAKASADGLTAAVRLNYVQVPVLVQARIPTGGAARPALYAGPSFGFRVGCRLDVSGYYPISVQNLPSQSASFSTSCTNANNDVGLGAKSFDLGGVVGGQLDFTVGGRAAGVGVRYTHGFSNVVNATDAGSVTVKNRAVAFYGAVGLPFGR